MNLSCNSDLTKSVVTFSCQNISEPNLGKKFYYTRNSLGKITKKLRQRREKKSRNFHEKEKPQDSTNVKHYSLLLPPQRLGKDWQFSSLLPARIFASSVLYSFFLPIFNLYFTTLSRELYFPSPFFHFSLHICLKRLHNVPFLFRKTSVRTLGITPARECG